MSRHRFFLDEYIDETKAVVSLADTDRHYAVRVLRLRVGESIDLVDLSRRTFVIELTDVSLDDVSGTIQTILEAKEKMRFELLQALPRGSKTEEILQKGVELGLTNFVPFFSKQSQIRLDPSSAKKKQERWQKIAASAASQSGRDHIPEVLVPESLESILKRFQEDDLKRDANVLMFIAFEGETKTTLKHLLTRSDLTDLDCVRFIVGPEGGFAKEEVLLANEYGYKSISLGQHILRTETAGPAILAILNYVIDQV